MYKKYLLQGGVWALIGKVGVAVLSLFLSMLLVRMLSAEEVGTYLLALNLVVFLSITGRFGLESSLLRLVADASARGLHRRVYLSVLYGIVFTTLLCVIIGSLYYFSFSALLVNAVDSELLASVSWAIPFWTLLFSFQMIIAELFRAFKNIRESVFFGGLLTSALTVSFFLLSEYFRLDLDITLVLQAIICLMLINVLMGVWKLGRKVVFMRGGEGTIAVSELFYQSWPLYINALVFFLMSQSDLWILAYFGSDEDVAIYGIVARTVLIIAIGLTVINTIVSPLIAQHAAHGEWNLLERLLKVTSAIVAFPALLCLLAFMIYSEEILKLLYGDIYAIGSNVLIILGISQVVSVLSGSCGATLLMTGHKMTIMYIALASAIIGISLSILLVGAYELEGVATGVLVGNLVCQLGALFAVKRFVGIWTYPSFLLMFKELEKYFRKQVKV